MIVQFPTKDDLNSRSPETNGSPYSWRRHGIGHLSPREWRQVQDAVQCTGRCNCSWRWGRYYYLFRQEESLINGRLIGFLNVGVITSKRGVLHVDRKGGRDVRCTGCLSFLRFSLSVTNSLIDLKVINF